ncbi:hypothetical protein TSAR_009854 [Trichomalopsis sarcophagae]|uniref:DDE Tnp4 domain-containing protein n=1 Tax=Trichomalopsis sarcophagae TaxID=543379 RepID=A0A232EG33_9HYME|nr:hypothetical protein TSAR_009854 [Trichomalopsis sarcophagae]
MRNTHLVPYYILCICILHNICLKRQDELEFPMVIPKIEDDNNGPVKVNNELEDQGIQKRLELTRIINENSKRCFRLSSDFSTKNFFKDPPESFGFSINNKNNTVLIVVGYLFDLLYSSSTSSISKLTPEPAVDKGLIHDRI